MSDKTRMTTFRRLADAGDLAPLLLQLMMAINDLGIADHGMEYWNNEQPRDRQNRVQGSKSYFVRLQIAHTFEALKVIAKIERTPEFMAKVERCDKQTQAAFKRLYTVIGTEEYKTMKRIRNAITFHYETDALQQTLQRQSAKFPDYSMSLSIGSRTLDWYFEPGDRVVDSIIARDAIGLAPNVDIGVEVDKVASRLQEIAEDLAAFAGYFVNRYCTRS